MSQDIWEEFEKIAISQGLVSEADQNDPIPGKTHSESFDDTISLLYGIKPESIYDNKKTIVENAHPETAVMMRAYDAMNGVVENLHQRQDMMAYIALKMPKKDVVFKI